MSIVDYIMRVVTILSMSVTIVYVQENESTDVEEDYPPILLRKEHYYEEVLNKAVIIEDIEISEPVVESSVEKSEIIQPQWQQPCATSSVKSYMDYKAITLVESKQYQYIHNNMAIENGLLYEGDYIGVALGSWWGDIGSKWTIELDSGIILKVVKVDEKSDNHTRNGCEHISDGSAIEIVIDSNTIPSSWWGNNGLVFNGNFNNSELFKGNILKVSRH